MNGKIYKWCCKNPECKMKNLSEYNGIDEASEKDLKLMLICAGCGFVETPVKIASQLIAKMIATALNQMK